MVEPPNHRSHGQEGSPCPSCSAIIRRRRALEEDPRCRMCGTRIVFVAEEDRPGLYDQWHWEVRDA
jgi:formamidopyrimidine-DNA glycosylase